MSTLSINYVRPEPATGVHEVELFEPAMCCSSGVCGPSVDQQLIGVREDLRWAQARGATVSRHNLSADPDAFVANTKVTGLMAACGEQALPVMLIDGEIKIHTTDPAAHVADALSDDAPDLLSVERIDPAVETARHTAEVLAAAEGLDAEGRSLLEEDLRSPCTEEIAVFRAFARTVDAARERIVVLDTAPTGHTLLLLDAAQSYHREVKRTNAHVPAEVSELLERLRDPEFARMLIVTLAESTPVHEAERLQSDLRRAGIEPFGWIINASLLAAHNAPDVARSRRR